MVLEAMTKALRHTHFEVEERCRQILMQLIGLKEFHLNAVRIIDTMLMANREFRLASIETQIKAFFLSQVQDKEERVSVVRRKFVLALKQYNQNDEFYEVCSRLLFKEHERTAEGVRLTNIIYDRSKHCFSHSEILNKPFS